MCEYRTVSESEWVAIGERLREARVTRCLGQSELADQLGLERTAITKLESGQRRMTALELVRVADALRVPMSWLVAGPEPAMTSRRSGQDAAPAVFDMDVALHETWEQVSLLAQGGHVTSVALPAGLTMGTTEEAERAAERLRAHLGLGREPLGGMLDVAAELGLHVVVLDGDVDGASMSPEVGLGVAVLGGRRAPGRRRFTCAHEIGHHVLGDEYVPAGPVGESADGREARIDAFAAAFLLPPAVRTATTRSEMIDLCGRYRVSWRLAVKACAYRGSDVPPTRAEFVAAGLEVPEDLLIGHRSSLWRQAVLAARETHDLTDDAALLMVGEPSLTLDDLPPLRGPEW